MYSSIILSSLAIQTDDQFVKKNTLNHVLAEQQDEEISYSAVGRSQLHSKLFILFSLYAAKQVRVYYLALYK